MLRVETCRQQRSHTRICRQCGYGGRELQRQRLSVYACPNCGCDLYARPPRSYAEMEGFDGRIEVELKAAVDSRRGQVARRLDRFWNWGVISFILVLLAVIVAQSIVLALQAVD